MRILDGERSDTNKIMHGNYVYHQDYRYLNIYRCSQRRREIKCHATLIVGENAEEMVVGGIHNHDPSPSVVDDSSLREEIKRLTRETLDSSTDILRTASLL